MAKRPCLLPGQAVPGARATHLRQQVQDQSGKLLSRQPFARINLARKHWQLQALATRISHRRQQNFGGFAAGIT